MAIIPLTEALWRAISVDEGFAKVEDSGYKRALKTSGHLAEKMRGLAYVRGRCGHQRALAVEQKGLAAPWTPPFTFGVLFRWWPAEDLPEADKPYWDSGKGEYRQWLASRLLRS